VCCSGGNGPGGQTSSHRGKRRTRRTGTRRRFGQLLANLRRKIQILRGRLTTASAIHPPTTPRTAKSGQTGHLVLHVAVPQYSNSARRRMHQGFQRAQRIFYMVSGKSADQKVRNRLGPKRH
jgi:hypothetical protein